MVAVLQIVVIPIWVSLFLLLTPFLLLASMFLKEEDESNEEEESEEQAQPLESVDGMELHGRTPDQPMATVSVHRSAEAERRRELVSASAEEEDSLLPRKLRENGHGRQQQRPEASIRRVRSQSVRYW